MTGEQNTCSGRAAGTVISSCDIKMNMLGTTRNTVRLSHEKLYTRTMTYVTGIKETTLSVSGQGRSISTAYHKALFLKTGTLCEWYCHLGQAERVNGGNSYACSTQWKYFQASNAIHRKLHICCKIACKNMTKSFSIFNIGCLGYFVAQTVTISVGFSNRNKFLS